MSTFLLPLLYRINRHIKKRRWDVEDRVARWYIFKTNVQIWVNFGEPGNGKCWYILWPFGICKLWFTSVL
jgi:hypothetical protein